MSDMPRPSAPRPTPDHARHDRALLAQFAAGDPLTSEQRDDAARLLVTCAACAELAADLRVLAAVVPREPVPARRRDFRLDAAQAERLRGNRLSRFLRRLSLPQSPAFGPVAAGVLSVGLVFVVAGYAWPGDGGVSVQGEPALPPAAVEQRLASPALEPGAPVETAAADVSEQAEMFMAEGPDGVAPDVLAETDALAATEAAGKSMDTSAAAADEPPAAGERAGPAGAVVADSSSEQVDETELRSANEAVEMVQALEPEAARSLAADDGISAVPIEGDTPIDTWLMLIGFGLAALGGFLTLLAWLGRRSSDPLLR